MFLRGRGGSCQVGECWHMVLTLPRHGEKPDLQGTVSTPGPSVWLCPLLLHQRQLCLSVRPGRPRML